MHVIVLNPPNDSKGVAMAEAIAAVGMSMVLNGKHVEVEPGSDPMRAKIYSGVPGDIGELWTHGWKVAEEPELPC